MPLRGANLLELNVTPMKLPAFGQYLSDTKNRDECGDRCSARL
jgi:hypothetical protein